jgi:HSP20 family protein
MSNLIRWEPGREMVSLRDAMDRLFNDAFTHPWSSASGGLRGSMPPIDMWQDNNAVMVKASLPGLKASDVQISVTGDMLTLRGEYKQQEEHKDESYHLRENVYGSFERSILLPTAVEADKAKAEFEDGILTITLPKSEQAKPKSITVKTK